MRCLFFSTRKQLLSKYSSLFTPQQKTEEGDDEQSEGASFSEHWGWFATIYHLSKTSILNITGDKSITDLNFVFALNYLAIDSDYNKEMIKAQKATQQTSYKIR